MLPDHKVRCPATGFARSCREVLAECDCPKFVSIKGANPQTGEVTEKSGCVDSFLPMLLLEGAQQSRQAGAAVESLRNEIVRANDDAKAKLREFLARGSNVLQIRGGS